MTGYPQRQKGGHAMNRRLSTSILIIGGLLVLFPLLLLVMLSLGKGYGFPVLFPETITIEHYKTVISQNLRMPQIICRSVYLSTIVALLSVFLGLLSGRAIGSHPFKGQLLIKRIMLLPLLVPMVSVAMGLHIVFLKLHLANRLIGVVLVQTVIALPYAVLIFSDLYRYLGDKWFDQGQVFGAVGLKKLLYVTIPLMSDGIISAFSICFIVSFSQYFVTVLIGGGRIKTFATEMFPFLNSGNIMLSSTYSIVFLLINGLMLLIVEVFIKGFVHRGLKLEGRYHD